MGHTTDKHSMQHDSGHTAPRTTNSVPAGTCTARTTLSDTDIDHLPWFTPTRHPAVASAATTSCKISPFQPRSDPLPGVYGLSLALAPPKLPPLDPFGPAPGRSAAQTGFEHALVPLGSASLKSLPWAAQSPPRHQMRHSSGCTAPLATDPVSTVTYASGRDFISTRNAQAPPTGQTRWAGVASLTPKQGRGVHWRGGVRRSVPPHRRADRRRGASQPGCTRSDPA